MAAYKLPEGQKLATFKIDEDDWEAFKTLCDESGSNASRTLISFVKQSVADGKIDELFLPKPRSASSQNVSSQSIDIDIDSLEARLMARFEARLQEVLAGK